MNKFLILATLFAASANAYTPIPRLEGFQEFLDNCICKEYKYLEERIRHVKDSEESVNFVVSGCIKDTLPSGKAVFRHIPEICCTRAQMDSLRTEIYAWKERCEKACPSFIPECDCGINALVFKPNKAFGKIFFHNQHLFISKKDFPSNKIVSIFSFYEKRNLRF